MLTIPINYTQLGGTYEILSGAQAGTQVFGQDPLWLAWATDLVNLKGAGDMSKYQFVLENWTPARFKVGQMIGSSGILMGMALAMYRNVDADKKAKYKSMYFSAALAVFLTGVTEPLEFMFMFAAVPLYVIYAVIQGAAFAMADILPLRVHSFGNIELLTRTPLAIKAGLGGDLINFVLMVIIFGAVTYFLANFLIKKFNYATPGRNGNYDNDNGEEIASGAAGSGVVDQQIAQIVYLLGGKQNIKEVDACMTRLRVSVKDREKVGSEEAWKRAGAMGLIVKDNGVQAVYGPKADVLKSDIEDLLASGVDIPEPVIAESTAGVPTTNFLGKKKDFVAVATGEVIPMAQVNDPVFSQKMMGDGFAVKPLEGEVVAPISGKVLSVFPSKHAIGLQTEEGIEVLVHMGIDTVEMATPAFESFVKEGQSLKAGTKLAKMNLDVIEQAGKETTIIVAFTNSDKVEQVVIHQLGTTTAGTVIGQIEI